jgi:hypothetical protein
MMPAALINPRAPHTVPAATSPSSNLGMMTRSVTRPSAHDDPTVATAKTAAPPTAMAKGFGCNRTIARIVRNPWRAPGVSEVTGGTGYCQAPEVPHGKIGRRCPQSHDRQRIRRCERCCG